jgi:hypothetical protein
MGLVAQERSIMREYRGRIEKGQIVLDELVDLPDGTKLLLELADLPHDLSRKDREGIYAILKKADVEREAMLGSAAKAYLRRTRLPGYVVNLRATIQSGADT